MENRDPSYPVAQDHSSVLPDERGKARWMRGKADGHTAPIKVAHVLAYAASRYGGPPAMARAIGKELSRLGVSVSFWATMRNGDFHEFDNSSGSVNFFRHTWPHRWYRSPDLAMALAQEARAVDLLHLHEVWSHPLYTAARTAHKNNKPYVITAHGTFVESWRYKSIKKRIYLSTLARQMILSATCFHAIVPEEVHGFREIGYQGPIVLIRNGVDAACFANLPSPSAANRLWPDLVGRRVILYLGRLSAEKGLDRLVRAWADVCSRHPYRDCLLVIAGPDNSNYRLVLDTLIRRYELRKRVLLTGMVSGPQKFALLARADICVLPSLSEVMGLSALEGMAAGKPVVITKSCNFPEVASAGAGLCIDSNPESLSTGLRAILEMSREQRSLMGARGRDLVLNNFTWETSGRKLATVYRQICAGKPVCLPTDIEQSGQHHL